MIQLLLLGGEPVIIFNSIFVEVEFGGVMKKLLLISLFVLPSLYGMGDEVVPQRVDTSEIVPPYFMIMEQMSRKLELVSRDILNKSVYGTVRMLEEMPIGDAIEAVDRQEQNLEKLSQLALRLNRYTTDQIECDYFSTLFSPVKPVHHLQEVSGVDQDDSWTAIFREERMEPKFILQGVCEKLRTLEKRVTPLFALSSINLNASSRAIPNLGRPTTWAEGITHRLRGDIKPQLSELYHRYQRVLRTTLESIEGQLRKVCID